MNKTLIHSIFIFLIMVFSISVSAQLSGDIISTTQKQGNMTDGILGPELMDQLKSTVMEDQVVEWLTERSSFNEKEIEFKELINNNQ